MSPSSSPSSSPSGAAPVPVLDAIGMVATDLARTLACYRLLGLDIPAEADGEHHVEVALPSGVRLMFDTVDVVRSFSPSWSAPSGGHRAALAWRCASPAEVDAVYQRLTASGLVGHVPPWDAVWGQRYAVVLDPDGTPIDLYAALEG